MENLIHGAIYLGSAKLSPTLIMPQVEGIVYSAISSTDVLLMLTVYTRFLNCTSLLDRLFKVNGQPIFIRGGNWILSDGLLRLSKERYRTDIKFHADMNLNMIRCWAGGLAERPEFYHYCDIYGLLVRNAVSLCEIFACLCVYVGGDDLGKV